jgi:SAM-dependent methyltransferase
MLAASFVANGVRLRRRCAGLERVTVSGPTSGVGDGRDPKGGGPGPDAWAWFEGSGVEVPDAVRRRVERHAEERGLDVVDLVPKKMPTAAGMDLLRAVNPRSYRSRRLASGATAGYAVAAKRSVDQSARSSARSAARRRALLTGGRGSSEPGAGSWPPEETARVDPAALHRWVVLLKRCAPSSTDLVVVDGLGAPRRVPAGRKALLRARYGAAWPLAVILPAAVDVVLLAGLYVSPAWGLVALALWCAQPVLTFLGSPLSPGDLWVRSVLRWALDPVDLVRTALGRREPSTGWETGIDPETLRPVYDELLSAGIERFFEPPRPDCPLCGSTLLREKLRTPDLLQHKPGEFVLMVCGQCGHIFQNPRLSLEGLDFYYRDFYDGLGEDQLEFVFGASDAAYRGRASLLHGRHVPRAWLDVGAGHGHFCLVAGEQWPATRFDGLDMSESIEEAERRGWVTKGYRGLFPELAHELEDRYDVVSMHHYLEHTRDPSAELDAALRVLQPGGYLVIELPDPESVYGGVLGKYWVPWFQPQHQHLLSMRNLEAVIEAKGMTVETTQRGIAAQPVDLLFAVWFLVNRLAPAPDLPWRPPSTLVQRVWRIAAFVVAAPVFVGAFLADQVLALIVRRSRRSNTYRVLARRTDATGPTRQDGQGGQGGSLT